MAKISDYDMFDYDYSTYWKKREYENLAEKSLLHNMLDGEKGLWFVDIGGSYGRLTSTYYDKYVHPLILDYSLKTLQKNREMLLSKYNNVELIAANAYKLPFAERSIDAGMMVRVLHHIEEPEKYFREISRVIKSDGLYIQEYANKVHIKAVIKALLKLDFNFFNTDAYKQPTQHNNEGVKEGVEGIFFNYHPKNIEEMMTEAKFSVMKKTGCSFLRSQGLKKILNPETMLFFEKIFQFSLSWTNISPSIFLKTEHISKKQQEENTFESLEDILVCPKCKNKLTFEASDTANCKKCHTKYYKQEGVWDFRVQ